ncbi:hypothetical protein OHA70_01985 [Kribbella sp. NBC_00382]|uniref:hypothetical protein n=1 Tax=Kribbella sp. NBC_00382 TaxID=2975967 RepID=UPI002E220E0B
MPRKLLGLIALTLAVTACDNRISCGPCGGSQLEIYLSSLRTGSTAFQVCVGFGCSEVRPIADGLPSVPVRQPVDEPTLVKLLVYRGSKVTDTYQTVLSLRPPDGDRKSCDCGEQRSLAPGAGGALITCKGSECSGPTR